MASEKEPVIFQSTGDGHLLISAISRFALELYRQQAKGKNGNLFMSPFSITAVLNMAYLGARGQTMEEMKATLCLNDIDGSKLHQTFGDLIKYFKSYRDKTTGRLDLPVFKLYTANRLFAEQSYNILPEFQSNCQMYYDGDLCPVDFSGKSKEAADLINTWVDKCTENKIKEVITPNDCDSMTRLILVNAIYFKSAWEKPFDKHNTTEADFFVSPGETIKVQMMYQKYDHLNYACLSDLHCQVVKLPYTSGVLSMIVFLPDKSSTIEDLEKNLNTNHLAILDKTCRDYSAVKLWLPTFKMDETLELKEVLGDMGMKSLFEPDRADLSGIDGTSMLYASKVIHKAFVDLNEEGTEAAGATAMMFALRCAMIEGPPPIEFRADHPFLFAIREENTNAILFLGKVMKPFRQ